MYEKELILKFFILQYLFVNYFFLIKNFFFLLKNKILVHFKKLIY